MKREQIIETYRKVYINSEADLPKEDGNYICLHKGETKLDIFPYKVNESHWFVEIDWYLQPIEQSEGKTAKTAEEILLKHIGKVYNCRSVFHNRYIAAMEEYRQQP